ncbi:sensor histidine kinase [Aeromicrobium wangtongii]|uniref:histidine kinase n=1 Tax=Aeromicrobium wangtongii TaxID=2969247 RepID=A0ABY5M3W3_9ACTN|nr:sensor histidine kinase [Aeromicrobium wangtongii]MCD9199109.1 sensor domain-containing protein [Aeromicrobium wangtongii]UUP12860.1 sensor domain-containing protein [Aeromicrobium wangtongii]
MTADRARRAAPAWLDGVGLALRQLVGGLGTAALAFLVLIWVVLVLAACLFGIGLVLVPETVRAVGAVAARERARLGRWGRPVPEAPPLPERPTLGWAVRDATVRREVRWLAIHGTWGLLLGLVGLALPWSAIRDVTLPLWWWLAPSGEVSAALWFWLVHSWSDALWVCLSAFGWALLTILLAPGLARLQSRPGRALLTPPPGVDLSLRIATLTATRAAALDAHATELRRIERSLHDSTQNPLVAANVLIGAARRKLATDAGAADELLELAQTSVERALGELRATVRSILPPVLADRGLAGAIAGLASTSGVPVEVDVTADRCAASVEASAYFMVSEALTNISRHSHAARARVTVRRHEGDLEVVVTDDGDGGANEDAGSGLAGIRRRIEAHDGWFEVSSPPGGPTVMTGRMPCGS